MIIDFACLHTALTFIYSHQACGLGLTQRRLYHVTLVPSVKVLISTFLFVWLFWGFFLSGGGGIWLSVPIVLQQDISNVSFKTAMSFLWKVSGSLVDIGLFECEFHIWLFGCWPISSNWKFTQLSSRVSSSFCSSAPGKVQIRPSKTELCEGGTHCSVVSA